MADTLTQKEVDRYYFEPNTCPFCGEEKLEADGHTDYEAREPSREVMCFGCGARWREVFRMVGLEAEGGKVIYFSDNLLEKE